MIRPLLALAAVLATTSVLSAQTVIRTQTRVDRTVVAQGPVTMDEARYIAARSGITMIEDIDFDNGDRTWQIEGRDSFGHDYELEIDAVSGRVIHFERD
jgi:hypothetical protein